MKRLPNIRAASSAIVVMLAAFICGCSNNSRPALHVSREADTSSKLASSSRETSAEGNLARLAASLDALSPLASLARGYAVVKTRKNRQIVRSYNQAPKGTELEITLAEGSLISQVTKSKPPLT